MQHPAVRFSLAQAHWTGQPHLEESRQRQILVQLALHREAEWVLLFDADDYAYFDGIDFTAGVYRLRAFDFYITSEDVDKPYYEREWMGPEYRDIMMLFRVHGGIHFRPAGYGREPWNTKPPRVNGGFVKHYAKAISVDRWEEKCDFYAKYYKSYARKWANRKGKAIHTVSDWGRPLMKWGDRFDEERLVRIR